MFQFSAFAFVLQRMLYLQYNGFPHSEICGSNRICQYPQLIAAYHVLHRLSKPRHPPCALINLLTFLITLNWFLLLQSIPICQWTIFYGSITMATHQLLIYITLLYPSNQPVGQLLWRISESNRWPLACKASALASWANPPILIDTFPRNSDLKKNLSLITHLNY